MSGFGVRPRPYVSLPTHRSAQGVLDGRTKRLVQREQCRARRRLAPGRRTDLPQSQACAWGSSVRSQIERDGHAGRGRAAGGCARCSPGSRSTPGGPVTVGALVDAVWDGRAPGRRAARAAVARLAAAPQRSATATRSRPAPGGYRLAVEPDDVDAHRFEALARPARRAARRRSASAAATLREALELWRGPALADLREPPLRARRGRGWRTLRLSALATAPRPSSRSAAAPASSPSWRRCTPSTRCTSGSPRG